jgi:hypothetical protein
MMAENGSPPDLEMVEGFLEDMRQRKKEEIEKMETGLAALESDIASVKDSLLSLGFPHPTAIPEPVLHKVEDVEMVSGDRNSSEGLHEPPDGGPNSHHVQSGVAHASSNHKPHLESSEQAWQRASRVFDDLERAFETRTARERVGGGLGEAREKPSPSPLTTDPPGGLHTAHGVHGVGQYCQLWIQYRIHTHTFGASYQPRF